MNRALLLPLFLLAVVASCGIETEVAPAESMTTPGAPAAEPEDAAAAEPGRAATGTGFDFAPGGPISDAALGDYYVELHCAVDGQDVGTMTLALWPDHAPITVRNFLRYCAEGFYDGLAFHRIMRDFMIQGGDPLGNGTGDGTYGNIQDEFSNDPARAHRYGVISMAHSSLPNSGSSQFYICNDDNANLSNLDGGYASFGRLAGGVATLEALSDVPVSLSPRSEPSVPRKKATITTAGVRRGAPHRDEKIERPIKTPDLGGEPQKVRVQHVLISFAGTRTEATRSIEEAQALAASVLARANAGEDFEALVRELSDDPSDPADLTPGVYLLLNRGIRDAEGQRAMVEASRKMQARRTELVAQQRDGTITPEEFRTRLLEAQAETTRALDVSYPREQMARSFGDVAFSLEVGKIGMASHDVSASPFGWHIIKRLE